MAYYADLTNYAYCLSESLAEPKALNVGWLSRDVAYVQGEAPAGFKRKLYRFCLDENLVRLFRGFHQCEFCAVSEDQWAAESVARFGEAAHLAGIGCGEIRAQWGKIVYAAPSLILHYILEHHYLPPEQFVRAVQYGPQPGSADHQALLAQWRQQG